MVVCLVYSLLFLVFPREVFWAHFSALYINDMSNVVSSAKPIYLLIILNAYTCTRLLAPQMTPNQTLLQNDINALFDYGNS